MYKETYYEQFRTPQKLHSNTLVTNHNTRVWLVEFCREMYHSHLIQENVKIKLRVSKLFWMVNMSSARDKERFECDCWAPVVSKRFCYTDHLLSSFLMQMWQSEDLILTAAYDKMPGWEGEKDEMRGEVAGSRRFMLCCLSPAEEECWEEQKR